MDAEQYKSALQVSFDDEYKLLFLHESNYCWQFRLLSSFEEYI